jgi:predicted nucleic acid-binding protein
MPTSSTATKSMTARPFLDTNLLVYAALEDRSPDAEKRRRQAQTVLEAGGVVSVQVLNEFVDLARRKFQHEWPRVHGLLHALELFCGPALPLTVEMQKRAVEIAERYGFRIYDAMIVASALEAGCTVLYSEGLQHGQAIDGLRVENPFRG